MKNKDRLNLMKIRPTSLVCVVVALTTTHARAIPVPEPETEARTKPGERTGQSPDKTIHPRLLESLEEFVDALYSDHELRSAETIEESLDDLRLRFEGTIPAEAYEKLKKTQQEALEEACTRWRRNAIDIMGRSYRDLALPEATIDSLVASLRQAAANPGELPDNFRVTPDISPLETDTWRNILGNYLDEEQLATLGKDIVLGREQLTKRYGALASQCAERYRMGFSKQIKADFSEITSALDLDKGRIEQLETTMNDLIDKAIEDIAEHHLDKIAKASRSERHHFLRSGEFHADPGNVTDPSESKAWRRALDETLTGEEQLEWKAFAVERDGRARETGARLMVTALDEVLSLDNEQRAAMVELLKRPAEKFLFSPLTQANSRMSVSINQVVTHAKSADQQRFLGLLTDWQRAHWERQLAGMRNHPQHLFARPAGNREVGSAAGSAGSLPPDEDQQFVETAITEYVLEAIQPHVDLIQSRYDALAQTTAAITRIDPQGRAVLEVAARGATELARHDLIRRYDTYARRQCQGADATNIHQCISGLRSSSLHGGATDIAATRMWNRTVESLLDDEQQQALEDFRFAQTRFRIETIGLVNAHLLAARSRLSMRQLDELAAAIGEQLLRYAPDIEEVYSRSQTGVDWYLYSNHNLIGLHAIPEKQFTDIVGEEAYRTWFTELRANGSSWWQQVRQLHQQRIRLEEESGKKLPKAARKETSR